MFTRCPECKTIFRVTDEQLEAAGGRVRCGHCAAIFNARDSLADSAAELQRRDGLEAQSGEANQSADHGPRPEFHPYATDYSEFLQTPTAPEPAHEDRAGTGDNDDFAQPAAPTEPHGEPLAPEPYPFTEDAGEFPAEPQPRDEDRSIDEFEPPESAEAALSIKIPPAAPAPQSDETAVAPEDQTLAESPGAEVPVAPEQAQTPPGQEQESTPPPNGAEPQQPPAATAANEPVPSILEDDLQALARRRSGWRTFAWSALIIGLLVAFGLQYTYFNRTDLVRDPLLRPWLERACQWAGCTIPLAPDLNKLRVLTSTVMVDPPQDDRLLILATMVNTADFPQPYPLLEVRLTSL
ncbi:MAG: DUF3426 domain-containing protein, partial [Pseudolabrys sp.]